MRISISLAMGFLLLGSTAQAQDKQFTSDVDALVTKLMTLSGSPGLAVTVIRGDKPVLIKGYGYADLERKIPITENTEFYIASTTKAFTGLTVALMADKGIFNLDAPAKRYLPGVEWGSGINTDSVTIRRLLTHTHGINNSGPVVWRTAFSGEQTDAQLKALLKQHGPSDAGYTYRYTNLGYNIAGLMIDEVTRGKWQDAIERYVTKPLGMMHTTAYVSRFDSAQLAMPYSLEPNGPKRLYYSKKNANMQAAGGLVTTPSDLSKWLIAQVNQGRVNGKQVFPKRVMAETQKLQVPASAKVADAQMIGYGFGWQIQVLNTDTVHWHGGGFSSYRTIIAYDLKTKTGVAVVTSEGRIGSGLTETIAEYVLEKAMNSDAAEQKYATRLTQVPNIISRINAAVVEDRNRRAARPQNLPHPLIAYTGTFENADYGTMKWSLVDGKLVVEMGVLRSIAEVYDNTKDALRADLEPGTGEVFRFTFEGDRAVSVSYSGREYVRTTLH